MATLANGEDAASDPSLKERWDYAQAQAREKFEKPISRAQKISSRVQNWFPVRVWVHFLRCNGFILAAGISYQALFTLFAAVYVAFAAVGFWLAGSPEAVDGLIDVINGYIPGLIGESTAADPSDVPAEGVGLISRAQVEEIVSEHTSALSITGAVAMGTVIWTAIGFVTYSRKSVRDIFGLPQDTRSFIVLKARDLLAALAFGATLLIGSAMTTFGTWALSTVYEWIGVESTTTIGPLSVRLGSVLITLAINFLSLAALVRFLAGTDLRAGLVNPGAVMGASALTLMQLGAGLMWRYTPSNPLLATFAIFVVLMLWFRLVGFVILLSAAWIATAAVDAGEPIERKTPEERRWDEYKALETVGVMRVRDAARATTDVPWYGLWVANRRLHNAQLALSRLRSQAPPPPKQASQFDI